LGIEKDHQPAAARLTRRPVRGRRRRKPAWGKIALAVLVLVALAAVWRYTPLSQFLAPRRVLAWAHAAGQSHWAPLVLIAAYTPAAFLLFPRPLITLVSVVAFGVWLGLTYAVIGILGAALATYIIGRSLRDETVRRFAGDALDEARCAVRGHTVAAVFAANMVPVPPFGVQGMIAGAMRLDIWQYSLGTLLSILPGALMLTVFGHQLSAALEDPAKISYRLLLSAALAFGAFIFFARRWARRRRS
jgi:uncharacterized membrane protein YdjX (TVP38/TMEM64 family)